MNYEGESFQYKSQRIKRLEGNAQCVPEDKLAPALLSIHLAVLGQLVQVCHSFLLLGNYNIASSESIVLLSWQFSPIH